jgi:Stress responsive A/B Barrel Domain
MFIHTVYFWLKAGLTQAEIESFEKSALSLLSIRSLKYGWVSKPASTDRPVIDRSYSYCLTTIFEDAAGHDIYQVDPIHDAFRDLCAQYWSQVRIYDSESI